VLFLQAMIRIAIVKSKIAFFIYYIIGIIKNTIILDKNCLK
jgi:hypothetical protein